MVLIGFQGAMQVHVNLVHLGKLVSRVFLLSFWTWEIYSISGLVLCYGLILISFINNYNVVYEWFGTCLQLAFYYNNLSHLLELLECAFANFEVFQFAQ
jgi:hypothetical protein